MENNNLALLKSTLDKLYFKLIERKSAEIVENRMTCRLIIDFQKGVVNGLQVQEQISGVSMVNYALSRLD